MEKLIRINMFDYIGENVSFVPNLSWTIFNFSEMLRDFINNSREKGAAISYVFIIFAASESYVNELANMIYAHFPQEAKNFDKFRYDVIKKYKLVIEKNGGLDEESEKFLESLKLLENLRGYLVHFKPVEEKPSDKRKDFEEKLAEKFPMSEGNVFTDRVMNDECLDWARETVLKGIRILYMRNLDPADPSWVDELDPKRFSGGLSIRSNKQ